MHAAAGGANRFEAGRIPGKGLLLAGALFFCCAVAAGCAAPAFPVGSAASATSTPTTLVVPGLAGEVSPNASGGTRPTGTVPAAGSIPPAAQSTGQAAGPDPAACRLLTPAEINAATGLRVTDGKPDAGAALPGEVSCIFTQQLPAGVRVSLFRRDDSQALFTSLLPNAQPVSGLGDQAKVSVGNGTAAIAVRKGSIVITLFVAKTESPAVTVAAVQDLANSALRRV